MCTFKDNSGEYHNTIVETTNEEEIIDMFDCLISYYNLFYNMNKMKIEERIRNLTTSEIFEVYENYKSLQTDGLLGDCLLKTLYKEYSNSHCDFSRICLMVFGEYVRRDLEW